LGRFFGFCRRWFPEVTPIDDLQNILDHEGSCGRSKVIHDR